MDNFSPLGSYSQRLSGRTDLDRFVWCAHNYSTQYVELYTRVSNSTSQGVVNRGEHQPTRLFTLSFETLINSESLNRSRTSGLSFKTLEEFYYKHGMHSQFIYCHPVYGDLVVRFNKPLATPKSRGRGKGSVEPFTLEFIEVLSSPYVLHPLEKTLNFGRSFPFTGYNVEVINPEDANVVALGGSHQMVFRDRQKIIRKFRLNFSVLQYHITRNGLSFYKGASYNCLLLEAFYLRYRLDIPFLLDYAGEKIPVVFSEPLKIPQPTGNTGCILGLELELVENPHDLPLTGFSDE